MATSLRRTFLLAFGFVLMIMVSACGGTTSTTSTANTSANTSASTPTSSTSTATIQQAQATVNGKAETILTNAHGLTLYYFTPDAPQKLACSGKCAQAWPPLLSDSGTPTSTPSLPGTLSVFKNANGNQVEYSGYLLYTFVKDAAPGQVTEQGVGKVWYVATPDLSSHVIRTAQAKVDGKAETILTDAQGSTLYYFTPDAPKKLACSGECAQAWPPLLSKDSAGTPLADASLSNALSTFNNANGNQVEYNGHLLYTFVKDAAPGQITGQGVGGKWFVATPSLAA
ncbi:MAG: hypothetical protein H0U76_29015 [Ktedonobacteraceae bacterium]|nr:hypothetical protein [Ktedonobacteraceae bacterium]